MFCVCHAFLSFHYSLVVTYWEKAKLSVYLYVQFSCVMSLSYVTRDGPAQARVYIMKNVLSLAEHGRCPHKY